MVDIFLKGCEYTSDDYKITIFSIHEQNYLITTPSFFINDEASKRNFNFPIQRDKFHLPPNKFSLNNCPKNVV